MRRNHKVKISDIKVEKSDNKNGIKLEKKVAKGVTKAKSRKHKNVLKAKNALKVKQIAVKSEQNSDSEPELQTESPSIVATNGDTGADADKPKTEYPHPSYVEMAIDAIKELNEKNGSTRNAIFLHILSNNNIKFDRKAINSNLKTALNRAVKRGILEKLETQGGCNAFKLTNTTFERLAAQTAVKDRANEGVPNTRIKTNSQYLAKAIKALNEPNGSTSDAILEYICSHFNPGVARKTIDFRLRPQITRAVKHGWLTRTEGQEDDSPLFKLVPKVGKAPTGKKSTIKKKRKNKNKKNIPKKAPKTESEEQTSSTSSPQKQSLSPKKKKNKKIKTEDIEDVKPVIGSKPDVKKKKKIKKKTIKSE